MALFNFRSARTASDPPPGQPPQMEAFLKGFSIEVMPRTAEKVEDFRAILPSGTRVYIAHIEGTPIEEMVATAQADRRRGLCRDAAFPGAHHQGQGHAGRLGRALQGCGRAPGPVAGRRRGAAGGRVRTPRCNCWNPVLSTGFDRLHVAGHPEGNKDIDPDGSDKMVMEAARWKSAFAERTDAKMAMATQFCFEAAPVIAWVDRLAAEGIKLPVHIGVAGPAKLQTLIKFAIACGVGPSLKVLQKRAMDVTKLLLPYEPTDVLAELAAHKAAQPGVRHRAGAFLPAGRHQDQCRMGHRPTAAPPAVRQPPKRGTTAE